MAERLGHHVSNHVAHDPFPAQSLKNKVHDDCVQNLIPFLETVSVCDKQEQAFALWWTEG
jgi:hypothetical protein